jgi:NADPH-dependent 2,4-dienoyl-CoA reductase/sulfur reductase-like enzyme
MAAGDSLEVKDIVTGQWTIIPLAGPANRQGRIAAESPANEPPFSAEWGNYFE